MRSSRASATTRPRCWVCRWGRMSRPRRQRSNRRASRGSCWSRPRVRVPRRHRLPTPRGTASISRPPRWRRRWPSWPGHSGRLTPRRNAATSSWHQQDEPSHELTPDERGAIERSLAGFDLRPQLPSITARTLVISGRADGLNTPEVGQEVADLIPGARFEVYEHSGHMLAFEEKDRLVADVTEMLLA